MEYEDIVKKTEYYIKESTRSNDRDNELDEKSFYDYDYEEARYNINFDKLKDILKENNIPIINYIRFNSTYLNERYNNRHRFRVILKNSIFY